MSLMSKIAKFQLSKTPKFDKLAHFYWGTVAYSSLGSAVGLFLICSFRENEIITAVATALPLLICGLVGLLKEIRDERVYGGFDIIDLKYTVIASYKDFIFLILISYIL